MRRSTAIAAGVLSVAATFLVPKLGYAETPSNGCEILPEGFIVCELPAAQKPWIVPLTPDCAIIREDEYSLTLRCRTEVGKKPTWVPGPKPVAHLPTLPKSTKKVKKRKKR